jgi:hypothetical protein
VVLEKNPAGDAAIFSGGSLRFFVNATNGNVEVLNMNAFFPSTDNAVTSGGSGFRWSQVWAANGTIQTSDAREKTEVTESALGTDFVKALHPVSYKWIEGGKKPTGKLDEDGNFVHDLDEDNNWVYETVSGKRTHWGFLAQEVKEVVDEAGVDFGGWVLTEEEDPDSQQALRYDQFIAPLTKALQESIARIEALEAEVAALKGATAVAVEE